MLSCLLYIRSDNHALQDSCNDKPAFFDKVDMLTGQVLSHNIRNSSNNHHKGRWNRKWHHPILCHNGRLFLGTYCSDALRVHSENEQVSLD